jgi:hypothetical protein
MHRQMRVALLAGVVGAQHVRTRGDLQHGRPVLAAIRGNASAGSGPDRSRRGSYDR